MDRNALLLVAPLLLIKGVFVLGLCVFALRVRRTGLQAPTEVNKTHRGLIGRFLQEYLVWMVSPLERGLLRAGVTPNQITAGSLVLSLAAAAALAAGAFGLGGWLYLLNGIVDIFDGRVARATGRVSSAGAFADSVADRVAEAAVFSGLAWYYHATPVLALVLVAFSASFLVSYARARGEGLGVSGGDVGRMQRPERILALGLSLALSPVVSVVWPASAELRWLAIGGLGLVALASLGTAIHRFRHIYLTLAGQAPPANIRPLRPSRPALQAPAAGGSSEDSSPSVASVRPR